MTQTLCIDQFIERANRIHKNKYDYSQSIYINGRTKTMVICKDHGQFFPTPENHISKKSSCPACVGLRKSTTKEFISRSKVIHNNKFDYSKVIYKNNWTKVSIACPTHGVFQQSPNTHLGGNGCAKCSVKSSKNETKWLDLLGIKARQHLIRVNDKKFIVDGYDSATKTVYEFLGDYWHGNPNKYDSTEMNTRKNITFGQLHEMTCKKREELISAGYAVIEIWESEFHKGCR